MVDRKAIKIKSYLIGVNSIFSNCHSDIISSHQKTKSAAQGTQLNYLVAAHMT